jgi:ABC-2 type transport system ATP-binding protein
MTITDEHVIVVDRLTKRYGELVAVDEVSFSVRRGEVFAFLGPNGAGKTTTVEIIETIRAPSSGNVSVLGMDVTTHKRDVVRRIGVLPQGFNSFERITVRESLLYYSRLFGADADIDRLITLTHLQEKRDVQFRNLSGGMKQRLGVAVALVNDPEVVFLDEPTTGLDPRARRALWGVLQGLKSEGKTIFLTTHYMEEAELLADTVGIISRGRIIAMGSPEQLIEGHAHEMCVTLKSVDDQAFDMVRRMKFEPRRDSRTSMKVPVKDTGDVQAILNAMKDSGHSLKGLDVRKPNLEEVFLAMTGEALRADDSMDEEVCT